MIFPYAQYSFYVEKVTGDLGESDFDKQIVPASFFLRRMTMNKSDGILTDAQKLSLQYAACYIAEMRAAAVAEVTDDSGNMHGGIKTSESNDGYSVSWASGIQSGETLEENINRRSAQIAHQYLAGTGLLTRKTRCCCDNECEYDAL